MVCRSEATCLSLTACTMLSLTLASPSSMWPLWVPQPNLWAPQSSVHDARCTPKSNPPQRGGKRERCPWFQSCLAPIRAFWENDSGWWRQQAWFQQSWNRVDLPCQWVVFLILSNLVPYLIVLLDCFWLYSWGLLLMTLEGSCQELKPGLPYANYVLSPCAFSPALGIFLNMKSAASGC